jgi:hypothetical protein
MFPVSGEKCLLCQTVHNCVEKFSQGHLNDSRPDPPVEIATEAKDFYAVGFDALVK